MTSAGAAATTTADDVLHVVKVNILGLTGITAVASAAGSSSNYTNNGVGNYKLVVDDAKTRNAVVAVMRDSTTYGITPPSKNLVPSEQSVKHFIAVWNNNNNNNKDNITTSSEGPASAITFETKIPQATKRMQQHRNFDLIVGLETSSANKGGNDESSKKTIQTIGAASLPLQDAARLANKKGKVVLDLPIFNVKSLPVDPFIGDGGSSSAAAKANCSNSGGAGNSGVIIPLSQARSTSSLRRKLSFPSRRRHQDVGLAVDNTNPKNPVYALDTAPDAAILRVELEIQPKETSALSRRKKMPRAVLLHSQLHAIETAHTVARSRSYDVVNNILYMEPSIEQVLSVDYPDDTQQAKKSKVAPWKKAVVAAPVTTPKKKTASTTAVAVPPPKATPTAMARNSSSSFRVKIVDQTTLDYELEAVRSSTSTVRQPPERANIVEDDKVHILDTAIERVLSLSEDDKEEVEVVDKEDAEAVILTQKSSKPGIQSSGTKESKTSVPASPKTSVKKKVQASQKQALVAQDSKKSPSVPARSSPSPKTLPAATTVRQTKSTTEVASQETKQPRPPSRTMGSAVQSDSSRKIKERKPAKHGPFSLMRFRDKAKTPEPGRQQSSNAKGKATRKVSSTASPKSKMPESPKKKTVTKTKSNSNFNAESDKRTPTPTPTSGKGLKTPVRPKTPPPKTTSTKRQIPEHAPSPKTPPKNTQTSSSVRAPSPVTPPTKRTPMNDSAKSPEMPPPSPKPARRNLLTVSGNETEVETIPLETTPQGPKPILKNSEATRAPLKGSDSSSQKTSAPSPVAIMIENVQNKEAATDWKLESVVNYIPEKQESRQKDNTKSSLPKENGSTWTPPSRPTYSDGIQRFTHSDSKDVNKGVIIEENKLQSDSRALQVPEKDVFGLVKPCGELEDILNDQEEEDSIAESYLQNDNNTAVTEVTQKNSLKHDFTELILGGLCQARGCQVQDDFSDEDSLTYHPNNRTAYLHDGKLQHHWVDKIGAAVVKQFGDDFDDLDSFGHSYYSTAGTTFSRGDDDVSGATFTETDTIFSDEDSFNIGKLDDQGAEIDVNEVQRALAASGSTGMEPVLPSSEKEPIIRAAEESSLSKMALSASKQPGKNRNIGPHGIFSAKENSKGIKKIAESSIGEQSSGKTEEISAMSSVEFEKGQQAPPRVTDGSQTRKNVGKAMAKNVHTVSARYDDSYLKNLPRTDSHGKPKATWKDRYRLDDSSGKDDPSPRNVMDQPSSNRASNGNSKSLAKSLVDVLSRAITPAPDGGTPIGTSPNKTSKPAVTNVPSTLETQEIDSVGELTATTHEILVDIEEYKKAAKGRSLGSDDSAEDNYFADYNQSSVLSPEIYAAEEAALLKRQAGHAQYSS